MSECHMMYAIIIGEPGNQYCFVCTLLHTENSSDPTIFITLITNTETQEYMMTENSKTDYINFQ
jgi:hypothetical protein